MYAKRMLMTAVAVASMGQAKAPEAVYYDVPHGSFPKIIKQETEGRLPKTGDRVGASFELKERGWEVTVMRGGEPQVRLQLRSDRVAKVQLSRVLLWASGDEQVLILRIPYGEPQIDCFANGADVFEMLHLVIPRNRVLELHDVRFDSCEERREQLELRRKGDVVVIAN